MADGTMAIGARLIPHRGTGSHIFAAKVLPAVKQKNGPLLAGHFHISIAYGCIAAGAIQSSSVLSLP